MTNHGDDCYFFYYSTCTKGDGCPFRHCEAAMGNETVCTLWQEGYCHRKVCKFRHMEIKKNRKEIPCYWENQPAGCQKAHCVFYHEKPRLIDGVFVPPSKGPSKMEEPPQEEPASPPPLPTVANPQLRGVLKAETQETVPSPTHPPVVINPADDDEDEDDQVSEEGEDGKFGPDGTRLTSPRRLGGAPISTESLNFGVSTLEEIKLRKALKASMRRVGYPVQSADAPFLKNNGANREKENMRSLLRPVGRQHEDDQMLCEEMERTKNSVIDRLGSRGLNKDARATGQPQLKRSLAQRLGRVVDEEQTLPALQNGLKPVKDRLGFPADVSAWPVIQIPEDMETNEAPQQIRIKSLEEIRQEKAAKSQNTECLLTSAPCSTTSNAPKGAKRSVTVRDASIVQMKTFPEILHAKRKNEDQQKPETSHSPTEKSTAKAQGPADASTSCRSPPPEAGLRVKTLEEIRSEKAARIQAQQAKRNEKAKSPEGVTKKPCLPRISKPSVPSTVDSSEPASTIQTKKNVEKPVPAATSVPEAASSSNNGVKVKTFEEIMREKRLRKQEMEAASSSRPSDETGPPQKHTAVPFLKKRLPLTAKDATPATTPPSSTAAPSADAPPTARRAPVRKRISLKAKAASPGTHSASTARTSTSPQPHAQPDAASQGPDGSNSSPAWGTSHSPALAQVKLTKRPSSQENSSREIKVRPKLNVKPSVMKPAAQVKPGQKRKLAARSAVAEVKPLNSTSAVPKEPMQEPQFKRRKIFPTTKEEAQSSPAVPKNPAALLGSGLSGSPSKEDPQTVPTVQTLPSSTNANDAPESREAGTVPQSPVMKTPTQSKPRRPSFAALRLPNSSASAVDDFEELMNEFTDDHLEEDMDPGLGEDDLLQELSEMIDS